MVATKTLLFSEEYVKITKGMAAVWTTHAREMAKTREVFVLLNAEHWLRGEIDEALAASPKVNIRFLPFTMPSAWIDERTRRMQQSQSLRVGRFLLRGLLDMLYFPFVTGYLLLQLRRARVHTVFSHVGGWPSGPLGRWIIIAAAMAGIRRRVLIVHNYPARRPLARWFAPLRQLQARAIARCATDVVTVSDSVRAVLECDVFKTRVTRIYNGIQVASQAALPLERRLLWSRVETPVVGFVGALYPLKGPHVLLDAFRFVETPCELALLGPADATYLGELQARARRCKNKVTFLGFHDDVDSFMAQIDFLVVPSMAFESFGLVILEAMRHRKAVICTDFGGMKEIVEHGKTGLIVPAGDIRALAGSITDLLADMEATRRMGEEGYRRLEAQFTAERMVSQYDALVGTARC